MPKKEIDPEDPFEMIGVELPAQSEDDLRGMALAFAEEFARDGWDREKLFAMFRSPFYQGPYLVWKQMGDEFVRGVIEEAMNLWQLSHHLLAPRSGGAFPRRKSILSKEVMG